jgi:hypothetical protein
MISGTISASDYLDAQQLHRSKGVRWYFIFCWMLIAIGLVLLVFNQSRLGVAVVCAGFGGFFVEFVLSSVYLPWKIRCLHRQQKDFESPFTYDSPIVGTVM